MVEKLLPTDDHDCKCDVEPIEIGNSGNSCCKTVAKCSTKIKATI